LLTEVPVETRVELFRLICLQRAFEDRVMALYRQGRDYFLGEDEGQER